jgi:hypothetical protein
MLKQKLSYLEKITEEHRHNLYKILLEFMRRKKLPEF